MNLTTISRRGMKGLCLVVLPTVFALIATAQTKSSSGGGTRTSMINVTSTVFDSDISGALLLFRSDDYNGSGEATYTSINNVESFLTSTGIWYLNLYPQKTGTRTVYITPNDAVGAQQTAPPSGYYWQNVEITSKCTDSSGNIVPFPNLVNGSGNCSFMVDFGYNGTVYKLLIGRVMNATDPTPGEASVACNANNSSNQCASWTITPNSSAANPNVANLYSESRSKGQTIWIYIGQYYNTFRADVTNP